MQTVPRGTATDGGAPADFDRAAPMYKDCVSTQEYAPCSRVSPSISPEKKSGRDVHNHVRNNQLVEALVRQTRRRIDLAAIWVNISTVAFRLMKLRQLIQIQSNGNTHTTSKAAPRCLTDDQPIVAHVNNALKNTCVASARLYRTSVEPRIDLVGGHWNLVIWARPWLEQGQRIDGNIHRHWADGSRMRLSRGCTCKAEQ